ncbi:MAG TPA: alanine racemase [Candidatus Angelobacter sp.]
MHSHPAWVEVSLTALRHNFRTVLSYVQPEADVCAVVTCDAYGHGASACSQALQREGAKWFATTTCAEGVELRESGITGHILLLGGVWRGEEDDVVRYELTPAVWNWNHLELLENAAEKLKPQKPVAIHLKVNTGMNRLGVELSELPAILETIESAPHLTLEGIFSHFAAAELTDGTQSELQFERLDRALELVGKAKMDAPICHIANSAGIVTCPAARFNLVRPGLSLYGYYLPFTSIVTRIGDPSLELPVKPALTWKTRVIQIREVEAGQPVGHSGGYMTEFPTRIAVLSVGYGDGLNRQLSARGRVIVRDDYAAFIGNISMNLTTVDVTGIPGVDVGDEVIIIGESEKRKITAWEHANLASTIPYEILCSISPRLPRKYTE